MKQNIDVFNETKPISGTNLAAQKKKQAYAKQIRMKSLLLSRLQNELKQLDQLDDNDFKDGNDPYINDRLLDSLQRISNQAAKHKLHEIQKLSGLALGRRILNIELKKKKDQRNLKLQKKEQIELFFRQNRIKRFDYDSLVGKGLENSKFIVKGYQNGKGFIESETPYQKYGKALAQCRYSETIRKVNNIFYKNYTEKGKDKEAQFLFKIVWIVLIIFICLGLSGPLHSQQLLLSLFAIMMGMLIYLLVKILLKKPSQNNAIQQSICDANKYFKQLNSQLSLHGRRIQWSCPNNFMYLQVVFHDGIPA